MLTEIKAPHGYVMDAPSTNVVIGEGVDTQTVVITNTPKGGLVINKLDSVTHEPLEGVEFTITEADGTVVDDNGGMTSSMGLYRTDENGQIIIDGLVGTFIITETKTIEGYTIHEETRTQTVVINPNDTQTITVYNDPVGGLELIKVNADDTKERIPNTTFEIRRMDDALVGTVTTDRNGRVFLSLENGSYYAVETESAEGFHMDDTPHYFEVENRGDNHPPGGGIRRSAPSSSTRRTAPPARASMGCRLSSMTAPTPPLASTLRITRGMY